METATTEKLITELASAPDWQKRRHCALALGRHDHPDVFSALTDALMDRDQDVRHAAVLSLGKMGDPRAIDQLSRPRILEDTSTNVRWAAVSALGKIGNLELSNAFSRSLQDPEWVVRNEAHLAIANFIKRLPNELATEQTKRLIRLFVIPDMEVQQLVVEALARRSSRSMELMLKALAGQSRVVRTGIANALGLSQDPRAIQPLIAAMQDPVNKVRQATARALGRLQASGATESLIQALGDPDHLVCAAARESLINIGDDAVPALCSSLKHSTPKRHRRNIILTLGGTKHPDALVPLLNRLQSTYFVVRAAAISAISGYGNEAVPRLIDLVQTNTIPINHILSEAQKQNNVRLRLRAIKALGEIKNGDAVEPLRKMLECPERRIRRSVQSSLSKIELAGWGRHGAVIALGNIGSLKAVPTLIRALRDPSEDVRGEAAMALAKLGHDTAVQPLIVLLENDRSDFVRRNAAMALWMLGAQSQEVSKALRYSANDTNWEVRSESVRALGRIDDQRSLKTLLKALEDSSFTVVSCARNALANLGKLAIPSLLEIIGGPDTPSRGEAILALQQIFPDEYQEEVASLTTCPPDQREAALETIREVAADLKQGSDERKNG